jgi:hypothetical protein
MMVDGWTGWPWKIQLYFQLYEINLVSTGKLSLSCLSVYLLHWSQFLNTYGACGLWHFRKSCLNVEPVQEHVPIVLSVANCLYEAIEALLNCHPVSLRNDVRTHYIMWRGWRRKVTTNTTILRCLVLTRWDLIHFYSYHKLPYTESSVIQYI